MADQTRPPAQGTGGMTTQTKRTLAKVGMATALGTLVATSLMETDRYPQMKRVHLWSGFALVGFSYWHYSLYRAAPGKGGQG
jgi:hypothetical protein